MLPSLFSFTATNPPPSLAAPLRSGRQVLPWEDWSRMSLPPLLWEVRRLPARRSESAEAVCSGLA